MGSQCANKSFNIIDVIDKNSSLTKTNWIKNLISGKNIKIKCNEWDHVFREILFSRNAILWFVIFIVETTLKPIANVIFKGIQC